MQAIFDDATRTAERLQQRSFQGRCEMLDTAITERRAFALHENGLFKIEWHGIVATGETEEAVLQNWISAVKRTQGDAA